MFVSIIIPVFNGEKYIKECVDSILRQTYCQKEVILVDDGSTDETGAICDRYSGQYEYIRTIHKKNGGVSSARNEGLLHAKGEAVMFVDADDRLDRRCTEELAGAFDGYDMVVCDFGCKNGEMGGKKVFSAREAQLQVIADTGFRGYVFAKLFRMEIIRKNQLLFDKRISYCEDELFVLQYLHFAEKPVLYMRETYYFYRKNEAGAMNVRYNREGRLDRRDMSEMMAMKEAEKWIDAEIRSPFELRKTRAAVTTLRTMTAKTAKKSKYYKKLLRYVRGNMIAYVFGKTTEMRTKVSVLLSGISPKLEYLIWRKFRSVP